MKNSHIVLATISTILAICLFCSSMLNKLWQFYFLAALEGLSCACVYSVTAATAINNWFNKKKGLALGIAGACPALTGAVLNPIVSNIILNSGWRNAYKIIGIIFLLLVVPAYLFMIRFKPSEMNSQVYGQKEKVENITGLTIEETLKKADYYLLILCSATAACITCYVQLLPKYGRTLPFISRPAILTSLSMIGNFICKLFIGNVADKKGPKTATLLTAAIIIAGFAMLMITKLSTVYFGSFFLGASTCENMLVLPLLTRKFYGDKHFPNKISYLAMAQNLFNSLGLTVFAYVIDAKGYPTSLLFALILSLLLLIATMFSLAYNNKQREI